MSFRIEEKLLINSSQIFSFKKWLNEKVFLNYLKIEKLRAYILIIFTIKCILTLKKEFLQEKNKNKKLSRRRGF